MTDEELSNIIKRISAFVSIGEPDRLTFYKKDGKFHFKIFSNKLYLPKTISKTLDDDYSKHTYDEDNNYEAIKDSLDDVISDISVDSKEGFIDFVPTDQKMVRVINDSYIKPFNRNPKANEVCLMPKASVLDEGFLVETLGEPLTILHEDGPASESSDNSNSAADNSSDQAETSEKSTDDPTKEATPSSSGKSLILMASNLRMPLEKDKMQEAFKKVYEGLIASGAKEPNANTGVLGDLHNGGKPDFIIGFVDYDASSAAPGTEWLVHSYARMNGTEFSPHGVFANTGAIAQILQGVGSDKILDSQVVILSSANVAGIMKNYDKITAIAGTNAKASLSQLGMNAEEGRIDIVDIASGLDSIDSFGPGNMSNIYTQFKKAYDDFNETYVKKGAFDKDLTASDDNDKADNNNNDYAKTKGANQSQTQQQSSQAAQQQTTAQQNTSSNTQAQQTNGQASGTQAKESYAKKLNRSWWLKEDDQAQPQSQAVNSQQSQAKPKKTKKELSKIATAKEAFRDWKVNVESVVGSSTSNLITFIARELYWSKDFADDSEKFNGLETQAKGKDQERQNNKSPIDFHAEWSGINNEKSKQHDTFGLRQTQVNANGSASSDSGTANDDDLSHNFAMYCCTEGAGIKTEIDQDYNNCTNIAAPDGKVAEEAKKADEDAKKSRQEADNAPEDTAQPEASSANTETNTTTSPTNRTQQQPTATPAN